MTQPTRQTRPTQLKPRFSPWGYSAVTFVLLWLSYPPVGWSLLAWVAPVPLLLVTLTLTLDGKRAYLKIYLTAVAFWLAAFYFLPYPHPILFVGWFALSAYLAVYTPLFIACARSMIHRWGVSPLIAIPVAWTGLEWIRVNFLTGFGMTCLSHTQYQWPVLIQISSLFGAYAVTFALTAFATGIALAMQSLKWRKPTSQAESLRHSVSAGPWIHILCRNFGGNHWLRSSLLAVGGTCRRPTFGNQDRVSAKFDRHHLGGSQRHGSLSKKRLTMTFLT